MFYYGSSGRKYSLSEVVGVGGEGTIYLIVEDNTLEAKIFSEKSLKEYGIQLYKHILWLSKQGFSEDFYGFKIAWPKDLLFTEKLDSGKSEAVYFCGYVMQKIEHICSLEAALTDEGIIGKLATLNDKIQIAYNYASFVNAFHNAGLIIGDFNLNNVLLTKHGKQYTISFIDCGGFSYPNEQLHFGARLWQEEWPEAPERKSKITDAHTIESDLFYLAVVMFRILIFNGNPFEAYSDNDDVDVEAEDNLRNGICLYIKEYKDYNLPDYFPKPGFIPDDIIELFNKSFNYDKNNIRQRMSKRATAQEWIDTLSKYQSKRGSNKFIQCKNNKQHIYFSHLSECPWCHPNSIPNITYEQRSTVPYLLSQMGKWFLAPCLCGSGKAFRECHGKIAWSEGKDKLAKNFDDFVQILSSGDDYVVVKPLNVHRISITLNGKKEIEDFFELDDLNDSKNKLIEESVREAIYRKERALNNTDEKIATKVQTLIDAIGAVTYTEECRRTISMARIEYSYLSVPQRMLVRTEKLSKAEAEYEALKKQAEARKVKKHKVAMASVITAALAIVGLIIAKVTPPTQENINERTDSVISFVEMTDEEYLKGSIDALNTGMNQGIYKQVIFGDNAVYCLNNDGTITVYSVDKDDNLKKRTEYSTWNNISKIILMNDYDSVIGLKNDGTVLTVPGAMVYQGEVDVHDWKDIVQIDASNAETVLGLTSEGTVLCTPTTRKDDDSQIFQDQLDDLYGSVKVVSVETKDVDILGLSSAGTVLPASTEYVPYTFYHGESGNHVLSWNGLKDISICSSSTDLFGLKQDGSLVYGGVFGYSGTEVFDENSLAALTDVSAISTGSGHLVVLKEDGTVLAAGYNNFGQCDVREWMDIARIEANKNTTVGYGKDGSIHYAGYNCLEEKLSKKQNEDGSATVSVGPIHYYHSDVIQYDINDYKESFGSNYWSEVSNMDPDNQLEEVYKEFFTRINADPVMAVACLAYVDKIMGTRYTGEFYSSISDDWINQLNNISDDFISDNNLWDGEVQALKKLLDTSSKSIIEVKGGNINSLLMDAGIEHPVLMSGVYSLSNDITYHFLTFSVMIEGTEMKLSFLIESGFAPVLPLNEV